jgi:Ca2+-transporting ATPase
VQLIVILIPTLHPFFTVTALNAVQWVTVVLASVAPLAVVEITKAIQKVRA